MHRGRDPADRRFGGPNPNRDRHPGAHLAHLVADQHHLGAAQCDRDSMTRNDPCGPSGPNAAHRHRGAGRASHRPDDARAAAEHDCRQAAAESHDHQRAPHEGRSVQHLGAARAYQVRYLMGVLPVVDS